MRITVIGTGYLGAVHAACMAELGHEVLGIDVDVAKIEALAVGQPPFHEPGLRRHPHPQRGNWPPPVLHVACGGGRVRRRALHVCGHAADSPVLARRT